MGMTADEIVSVVVFCVLAVAFVIECCVVFLYYKLQYGYLALEYLLSIETNKSIPLQKLMGLNREDVKKNVNIETLHKAFWNGSVQIYITDNHKNK